MINLRKYGNPPFGIAVIHGGPGAPGEMAPVARELSFGYGVLEPLQTKTTVEELIQELKDVLKTEGELPITLIGWSWGAWLSLIFTAQQPKFVKKLILIGSGPYEDKYAREITKTRLSRLSKEEKTEVKSIMGKLNDPITDDKNIIMARLGKLIFRADTYDPQVHDNEVIEYQYYAYLNIWNQANELRKSGKLLELGKKIQCPVVAIHGDFDPHPAKGTEIPLSKVMKDFRFILLEKCGHYPWFEGYAKDRFYNILKNELR